ncbi:hypothetical protein ABID26_007469, partial [Mesorhizobium shonense]
MKAKRWFFEEPLAQADPEVARYILA